MAEKLMLIDANSVLNRAFYGLQGRQLMHTKDGLYTNAIYGFVNIVNMHLEAEKPQFVCAAFDMKAPTFRHMEYEEYKAKRKAMPEELAVQLPYVKEVIDVMGIKRLEYEGFEADDIIGSMAECAEQRNMEVVIVTGDRDSLQLAGEKTRIKLTITKAGRPVVEEYDASVFKDKYGITPQQFIDVKGLMGDPSDNIPGVKGIGEVTAFKLIKEFGSIENIYNNMEKVEPAGTRKKLDEGRESAILSRKLSMIERNMPELCQFAETKKKEMNKTEAYELFRKLEFYSFIERFGLKEEVTPQYEKREVEIINDISCLNSLESDLAASGEFAFYPVFKEPGSNVRELEGVGFCCGKDELAYVDLTDVLSQSDFFKQFEQLLLDKEIHKSSHDIKPFIAYMKSLGYEFNGLICDTMIAAYLVNPSRQKYDITTLVRDYLEKDIESVERIKDSCDKASSRKTKTPAKKANSNEMSLEEMNSEKVNSEGMNSGFTEKIAAAAGLTAKIIVELRTVLENKLEENDQISLYQDIEIPLIQVLADMEAAGFKINRKVLTEYSEELDSRIKSLTDIIYFMAGEEFNINSPKQLGQILFEQLGLPIIKKTKTGYSTDAEVLQRLSGNHEIVDRILEYRQLAKLKSTYVDGLLAAANPETGKLHSNFNQTAAVTGRISSTEPNLQNIPIKLEMGRKIRKFFIPSMEGNILIDADYSQIELRVLAHISKDENMIEAFINGDDIHRSTAAKILGIPLGQVTPQMRNSAKAVNFGIVYGIGEYSLSQDLGIPRKQAAGYIREYLEKYSGVRQYMHDIVEEGRAKGFVKTLFGRIRYIPEIRDKNFNTRSFGERIALNTPIQGTAADIIKVAMVRVYNSLREKKLKSRLILQVHDELIVESNEDEKDEVIAIVKDCMENAAHLLVPLTVDISTGYNWYDAK